MITAFTSYIDGVLGLRVEVIPATSLINALPYFLHEAFTFAQARLCGQDLLLLIDKGHKAPTAAELRQWVAKARGVTDLPAVYVAPALASYQRKRLIEQKVPFVVPGNQLYLPDLGLDLREYFKQVAKSDVEALTPSAQLMLIHALLRGAALGPWYPVADLKHLGYTAMTVSRATRELVAAQLITTQKVGRELLVDLADVPNALWERAQPLCKSPVQRQQWVKAADTQSIHALPLAGESALTKLSMLNPPRHEVRALHKQEWPDLQTRFELLPEAEEGATLLQLWTYPPLHQGPAPMVDKLSLWLSMRDVPDDRVQMALDELKETWTW
jgi:DNA-binding MarR family transcriptional regulator